MSLLVAHADLSYFQEQVFLSRGWNFRIVCAKNYFLAEADNRSTRGPLTTSSAEGSHFFGLTKFYDISMIFPGFLVNFQVFFFIIFKV